MRTLTLKLVMILVLIYSNLNSQYYTNIQVSEPFGNSSAIHSWSSSIITSSEHVLTVGNNVVSDGNIAIYVTKRTRKGTLIWESNWLNPNLSTNANYGTGVFEDASGNFIVIGATSDGQEENTDIVVLKYDINGSKIWETLIDGQANDSDIPTGIVVDSADKIYVTAISKISEFNSDILTLKLDTSGSIIWDEYYDDNGAIDIPVKIILDRFKNPIIKGVSSDPNFSWDLKILKYHKVNANLIRNKTIPNAGQGMETPTAIAKDENDFLYVTGNSIGSNGDNNIITLKLDEEFDEVWSSTYDYNSREDFANDIVVSSSGKISIIGYSIGSNNSKDLLVLNYANNGSLNDEFIKIVADKTLKTEGLKGIYGEDENLFVIGSKTNNSTHGLEISKFNSANSSLYSCYKAMKFFNLTSVAVNGNGLDVTIQIEIGNENKYQTIRISDYFKDSDIVYNSSTNEPRYYSDELIVRFDESFLKYETIDNLDLNFGNASDWLTDDAIVILNRIFDINNTDIFRIYPGLRTTDDIATTRAGKTIPMPKFWSSLLLKVPASSQLVYIDNQLEDKFEIVKWAHPNLIATVGASPNDELYPEQASLNHTTNFPNAGINIEPLWDRVDPNPSIKLGILDSGWNFIHEDFTAADGSFSMSQGWSFGLNSELMQGDDNVFYSYHGTRSAGVIGAIRNNEVGIAGVSGGFINDEDIFQKGTSLFGLNIFWETGIPLDFSTDAILNSIQSNIPGVDYDYGLDILSNSWYYAEDQFGFYPKIIEELSEVVRFANRMGVIFVACRGNGNKSDLAFPGCLDDKWVLNIGGSGPDGEYQDGLSGLDDFIVRYDGDIDIVGPASEDIVRTTGHQSDLYVNFNGCSSATPMVSGVSSLLAGYYLKETGTVLVQEDIEFILQMTATNVNVDDDIDDSGYDIFTGFGRLNAGNALDLVHLDENILLHRNEEDLQGEYNIQLISSDILINLAEVYETDFQAFEPKTYKANKYKITGTFDNQIQGSDLLHIWPRHSASTFLPDLDANNNLIPHEEIFLDNSNNMEATFYGFIYELKDVGTDDPVGWIPRNITDDLTMAYSVIATHMPTSTYVNNNKNFTIQPNPSIDQIKVSFDSNSAIDYVKIVDAKGAEVFNKRLNSDKEQLKIDVRNYPAGVYIITLYSKSDSITNSFIKQ